MEFSFAGRSDSERFKWFAGGLRKAMERAGHTFLDDPDQASLVVNFFDQEHPRPFRRRGQAVFVTSVSEVTSPFDHPIPQGYPLLVRSLSNLFIGLHGHGEETPDAHFITPEQGYYVVAGNHDETAYFDRVYGRIRPLATSRLVIDNVFDPDLEPELWEGDEVTESIHRAGARMDALDLIPAPFPLHEILPERDRRHLKRLYGMGGLSYGNVSARKDDRRFWMSASGVDKSKLVEIGRDVLLVKDYDPERNANAGPERPPGVEPRLCSGLGGCHRKHWMDLPGAPGGGGHSSTSTPGHWYGVPPPTSNFPSAGGTLRTGGKGRLADIPVGAGSRPWGRG